MIQRDACYKGITSHFLGLKGVSKSCFLFLLVLLFDSSSSSAAFGQSYTEVVSPKETFTAPTSDHLFSELIASLQVDLDASSNPIGQNNLDKDDLDDDYDDDSMHRATQDSSDSLFQITLDNNFSSLNCSIQNRSSVPLFVLYHSWKTYLS